MTRFIVFTSFTRPGLHVWREGTQLKLYLEPLQQHGLPAGFHAFDCELGVAPQEKIYSLLFQWNQNGTDQIEWEQESHIHEVPRLEKNRLPQSVWLFHGSARAVAADPLARQQDRVRIHLLTAARYMHAELLVWNAPGPAQQTIPLTAHDESGPFWDLDLSGRSRSFFQFKFRRPVEGGWKDEHDFADRLWVSQDGAEVWTHSEARDVLSAHPIKRQFTMHFRQEIDAAYPPRMHVWQEGSDFESDIGGETEAGGWTAHRVRLYTGLPYRLMFFNPTFPRQQWESEEARRYIVIQNDTERWTLEGDNHLFEAEPQRNCRIHLTVAVQPADCELTPPLAVEAWVNRARAPIPAPDGLVFVTYADVVTSFRLRGASGPERIDRHYLTARPGPAIDRWLVLGRSPVLEAPPPRICLWIHPSGSGAPALMRNPASFGLLCTRRFQLRWICTASGCRTQRGRPCDRPRTAFTGGLRSPSHR